MDWTAASEHLRMKLDPAHVKARKQGGAQVSYIEGWHAIAEANRIFGFDAWTRETLEMRLLGGPREVEGKMRVEYMARVRITVAGVVREGCGFGQGIDRDAGQAHESALKEAETDAMKRAFMTFGNPFGLALYDKTRENVGSNLPPFDAGAAEARILSVIAKAMTREDLTQAWNDEKDTIREIGGEGEARIKAAFKAQGENIKAKEAA
jgi:DNA recombination protein Rad52